MICKGLSFGGSLYLRFQFLDGERTEMWADVGPNSPIWHGWFWWCAFRALFAGILGTHVCTVIRTTGSLIYYSNWTPIIRILLEGTYISYGRVTSRGSFILLTDLTAPYYAYGTLLSSRGYNEIKYTYVAVKHLLSIKRLWWWVPRISSNGCHEQ